MYDGSKYDWKPLAREILFERGTNMGAHSWESVSAAGVAKHWGCMTTKVEELRNHDPLMPNPREHSVAAIGLAIQEVAKENGFTVIVDAPPGKAPRIYINENEFSKLEEARQRYLSQKRAGVPHPAPG